MKSQSRFSGFSLVGVLVLATFLAFSPILRAGFTNWDDPVLVTQNPSITGLSWSHWVTFFTTLIEKHYHPLVMVSYAVDYRLFGLDPLGFHLTNLGIHLVNTALVFWLFSTLGQDRRVGFVTAALFGWHPMHVESVAWIAERKDVLYTAFFWAALLSHTYYVRRKQRSLYWLCLGLFVLSLLSKSMAVTLPAVLLLVDWFHSRKIDRSVIIEKLPHFALSLGFAVITMVGHRPGAGGGTGSSFSAVRHIRLACENLMFYVVKFVAPINLAALYPRPRELDDFPAWFFAWSPLFLLVLGAAAYRFVRPSKPATFGLLFFFVTYFPVSQIVPFGVTFPADRYTYVPYVGLFFALVTLIESHLAHERKAERRLAVGALVALVLGASWSATFQRVKVWHASTTLWEDSVAKYPVARAYLNLGVEYLAGKQDLGTAQALFSKAIAADPKLATAWLNRGVVFARQRDYEQAITNYNEAEKLDPKLVDIYLNRGIAYAMIGRPEPAIMNYSRALTLRPGDADVWLNRGNVYLKLRRLDRAIADFTEALRLGDSFAARLNRGNAYWSVGNWNRAFDDFTAAIQLQPSSADAYYYRARIYSKYGQPAAALSDALKARSLGMKVSDEELARLQRQLIPNVIRGPTNTERPR